MLNSELEVVGNSVSVLGECPVWDAEHGRLYWIDSLSKCIHLLENDGRYQRWQTPQVIGSFALCENGLGLCAFPSELNLLKFGNDEFEHFTKTPNNPRMSRLNDGKCDRVGRFWVGTLTDKDGCQYGELYRVDPDGSVTKALDQFTNSNGLAFPPSTDFFFHSDSRAGGIHKITCSGNGQYQRSLYHQTNAAIERPDGAAIDEQGYYWSALYGGGAVIRVDPEGREVFRLRLPTPYPTMIAFGGDDLRTLYITTATLGGMKPQTANDPMAGRLFSAKVQVSGLPEPRFGY